MYGSHSGVVDQLHVHTLDSAEAAGAAAGEQVADALRSRLERPGHARVVFAAAPSQDATLRTLATAPGIDWSRVTAFQMDEYIGLRAGHPQRFATYLDEHIFSIVRPGRVHMMMSGRIDDAGDHDGDAEAARYAALFVEAPIDVVCLGIGENGHIAFNDPGVADFADPLTAKVVALDAISRQQQVNDGCFTQLEDVPTTAITLTVPALLSAEKLVACVSGRRKRGAVHRTLTGPITHDCPASALRQHDNASLFLDGEAAPAADLLTFQ